MPYRRNQYPFRRYPYFSAMPRPARPANDNIPDTISEIASIPLPNEVELPSGRPAYEKRDFRMPDIFGYLKKRIKLEDIILIGLIFLLIEEGIEDELLLLILVFLLLT